MIKYLGGDIYRNAYVSSFAEIFAKLSCAYILVKCNLKPLLVAAFTISFVGALLLILLSEPSENVIAVFVMMVKFGMSMGFVGLYLGLVLLFPTTMVSTAMGVCNVIGRCGAIMAPLVAELAEPVPMICVSVLCGLSIIASFMLKQKD